MLVSIVVPARNEEASLGACLESLVAQGGVEFEIIVVDDGSTDRTREIAASFAGVRVISAAEPEPGMSGKCNAVWTGAQQARGEWLLFTDADTVHKRGSLAHCLEEAQQCDAKMFTLSPEQEVHGFWEKAVMPVIFAELACNYRPAEVCDPASPSAAANGQYLLVQREAYFAVGGHRAVAHTLLEDVALAQAFKGAGYRLRFRFGGDAVRTRMYRSWCDMRDGWTKNLALLFPQTNALAGKRAAEFLLAAGGIGSALGGWLAHDMLPLLAGLAVAVPT